MNPPFFRDLMGVCPKMESGTQPAEGFSVVSDSDHVDTSGCLDHVSLQERGNSVTQILKVVILIRFMANGNQISV